MSILRRISNRIDRIYTQALCLGGRFLYLRISRRLYKRHEVKVDKEVLEQEKKYCEKWSRLRKNPDKYCFRLFSQYIGSNPDIVPEDISSGIIQPLLNPIEYRPYYCDKNMFEKIFPAEYLPKTLFRRIRTVYYDCDYNAVEINDAWIENIKIKSDKIFIKPSVDSSSGAGVMCFKKTEHGFVSDDGIRFDIKFLNWYSDTHDDFIVQEGLSQSAYMSMFNPSSINTIRVATYKSVRDDKVHVCGIIIRIGKAGSYVDNAHAGGVIIGVDKDGKLASYACDQYGNKYKCFNGVNFNETTYCIPSFDRIIKFAESVGDKIIHHRLIAQDIAILDDGTPCLVEFNIRAFAPWSFQFTIGPALGEYADEIIEYCANKKKDINKVFVEPF